jgi:hypothetical protein
VIGAELARSETVRVEKALRADRTVSIDGALVATPTEPTHERRDTRRRARARRAQRSARLTGDEEREDDERMARHHGHRILGARAAVYDAALVGTA